MSPVASDVGDGVLGVRRVEGWVAPVFHLHYTAGCRLAQAAYRVVEHKFFDWTDGRVGL